MQHKIRLAGDPDPQPKQHQLAVPHRLEASPKTLTHILKNRKPKLIHPFNLKHLHLRKHKPRQPNPWSKTEIDLDSKQIHPTDR
jgi:hypothetical protein